MTPAELRDLARAVLANAARGDEFNFAKSRRFLTSVATPARIVALIDRLEAVANRLHKYEPDHDADIWPVPAALSSPLEEPSDE